MSYGLKYQSQFDSVSDANNASKRYTIQFLFKDYTGGVASVDGISCVQRSTTDDPVAPIKGQSLDISLLNKNNSLPISSFFSEDDDGIQVKLLGDSNEILFIGFLVQDDFYEPMVDYSHPITLLANDGLGLLKGVVLSDAEVRRSFTATFRTLGGDLDNIYIYTANAAFYPQVGNTIEILGITYTIDAAQQLTVTLGTVTYNWYIRVSPTTGGIAETTDTIYLTGEINLRQRNTLLTMIAVCLAQTNLSLVTNIFLNLFEYRQDPLVSTFDQTLIDSQLFISGETYEDCYSVLTKILTAFNCTLFQANGQWNIVHFPEAKRYTNNEIPGFVYDETWQPLGSTVLNNNFFIGPAQLTRPIHQLTQGALRGYKFSRKVFNYRQPKYLLQNYDLQQLGALLRTLNIGGGVIHYEYEAPGWLTGVGPTLCERFIRIIKDSTGTEIDRYLVLRANCSNTILAVASDYIEAQEKDRLIFSFSTRTNFSQAPPFGAVFGVRMMNGVLTRYVDELPAGSGAWIPTVGFNYSITNNTNQWTSVEIASSQIPFDGQLSLFLAQNNGGALSTTRETHYKDIRLEYIPYVNDTTKITGQIHKQEQPPNKKLNTDGDIQIDDSPRNNVLGTLFLPGRDPDTPYGLQIRTKYWRYPSDATGWRLGELTTLEDLTWRQQTRSKLEGGFIGNYQTSVISLLSFGITDFNPTKSYTWGLLTIDYKNNQCNGTLWELSDTEQPELDNTYTFTYIYSAE